MKVSPDDEVYRIDLVWLGPTGLSFPWTARYSAYFIWLVTFLAVLLFKAVTPFSIGVPPVWEIVISVLATYGLMGFVDHERPPKSLVLLLRAEVTAPRKSKPRRVAPAAKFINITKRRR